MKFDGRICDGSYNMFFLITRYPRAHICIALLLVLGAMAVLPGITKDTRTDAYLSPDNSALKYRDTVKQFFGLSDPYVVAIYTESPNGVYTEPALLLLSELTARIKLLPNIDPSRVYSLASENNIRSDEDSIDISPFYDGSSLTPDSAQELRASISEFEVIEGGLVAENGQLAIIAAEVLDESRDEATYFSLEALLDEVTLPDGVSVHLAGEGAVSAYLGRYMDDDARRLNPLAAAIILGIVALAFRRLSAVVLCLVVVVASLSLTFGTMAVSSTPVYIITNALPVILIGIAVADSIHILVHYFDAVAINPDADKRAVVVATMTDLSVPITLTSLTTIGGFMGIYLAAYMPPFQTFGLFAALGVAIACLYSLVFLPAALVILKPSASQRQEESHGGGRADFLVRSLTSVGTLSARKPRSVIVACGLIATVGLVSLFSLQVDEDRIGIFHPSEPIRVADTLINRYGNGTGTLDIVIEASQKDALLDPQYLIKIERLQEYAESLPGVTEAVAITDYLKQINKAFNKGDQRYYVLPETEQTVAQYLLVYSALADASDFSNKIDYNYQNALIRVSMNTSTYQTIKLVVENLESYLGHSFNDGAIRGSLSGRATLTYHWVKDLAISHFTGMALALVFVGIISALVFRSSTAGLITLAPVVLALLMAYAGMSIAGENLGVGSSMFAAVAVGLGIDFSIHTLERFRKLIPRYGDDLLGLCQEFYAVSGRALFLNFAAITCGFSVLFLSDIRTLVSFSVVVVLSMVASFLGSILLIPAILFVCKPRFLYQ